MTDIVDKKTRSRMMAGIRAKDTRPEMIVRKFLHAHGFRYRLHDRSLPGCPDIILPRYRTVIFVNGCFWHRHPGCSLAYFPKSNQDQWQIKFKQNVERDFKSIETLLAEEWRVIVLWECGLRTGALTALEWLPETIRSGRGQCLISWPVLQSGS